MESYSTKTDWRDTNSDKRNRTFLPPYATRPLVSSDHDSLRAGVSAIFTMSTSFFIAPNRRGDAWFSVGLASSFPDITDSGNEPVSGNRPCGQDQTPSCKVWQVPSEDATLASEVDPADVAEAAFAARDLKEQVLVFQYKGKFHAINNVGMPEQCVVAELKR